MELDTVKFEKATNSILREQTKCAVATFSFMMETLFHFSSLTARKKTDISKTKKIPSAL